MIRIRGLQVCFGDVCALELAELDIQPGEKVHVCGSNGSGKSTLLRVLAGLQAPTAGAVHGVPDPGRAVLVQQHPLLFRGSALSNVALALRAHGRPAQEAMQWLSALGAAHLAQRQASALSGGERRRVAIARALAARPEVLLLDEPLAELDAGGVEVVAAVCQAFVGIVVIASPVASDLACDRLVSL